MPSISIICPVHNMQQFMRKCIDSIRMQAFTDWELILVDDGSTDQSGSICDQYVAIDDRIKVIHQKNAGVSAARQAGSETATGEYVIHMDPDDYAETNMLGTLYQEAVRNHADVVICDFFVDDISGKSSVVHQRVGSTQPDKLLRALLFQQLHGSCWNKLVRRACSNRYNVRFPKGVNYCEDVLFWVQLFRHSDVKTVYLPKAFYHYVMHERSITHNYTRNTYENRQSYVRVLRACLPPSGYEKEWRQAKLNVFFEAYMHGILKKGEAWRQLWENRRAAFFESRSWRYKMGYAFLFVGCFPIAKRLLKY